MTAAGAGSSTFKARDVEELVDFYLNRRAANLVVRVLAPTSVTPNQVTIGSGLVAIVAGALVWNAHLLAGAAFLFLSIVLDCVDGQLARLRRQSSYAGRALDGYVDVVSVTAIMVGQLGWLLQTGHAPWLVWGMGWATAFSLRWHTHTYDHVKNVYLRNTEAPKGADIPSLPPLEDIERERLEHARAGRWFSALLCRGFSGFSKFQRKGMQRQAGNDRPGSETAEERLLYRQLFRRYMRAWSFNGLGTHLTLLLAGTVLATVMPGAPLWVWGVMVIPANLGTVALVLWGRRLEERFARELAGRAG